MLVHHVVRGFNRLITQFLAFFALVLLFGDIPHYAEKHMIGRVVNNRLFYESVVFRKVSSAVAYAFLVAENFEKRLRIENTHDLIAEYVRSVSYVENFARRGVDLLNFQSVVDDDERVRRVGNYAIGKTLGFFFKVGQTHRNFRLAVDDRYRFFAAGIVPA